MDFDRVVNQRNEHMPFLGQVVLLGVKGTYRQIDLLGILHRVEFNSNGSFQAFYECERIATRLASQASLDLLIGLVVKTTGSPANLAPDTRHVVILSVNRENGEIDILDRLEVGSSFRPEWIPSDEMIAGYKQDGYSYYLAVWVLDHEWPE